MKNNRHPLLYIIVACLLLLSGCESPKATIKYTPVAAFPMLNTDGDTPTRLAVIEFTYPQDETGKTSFTVFNGWGVEAGHTLSDNNIGLIFAEATVDALRKSGLHADVLTQSDYEGMKADYDGFVTGDIESAEIRLEPGWGSVGANAQISTLITVNLHRIQKTYGPILSESSQSGSGYELMGQYTMAIDGAIQDYARQFIRLMKKENAL